MRQLSTCKTNHFDVPTLGICPRCGVTVQRDSLGREINAPGIAAERERCAKAVEETEFVYRKSDPTVAAKYEIDGAASRERFAKRIRSGE